MIRRPTVFVLGAGASAPYGFPLGTALTDGITWELTRDESPFRDDLQRVGYRFAQLREFGQALAAAGRYSIDDFLQDRPQFRELGKLAIARMLIPAERDDRLDFNADPRHWMPHGGVPDTRWYRYLFNQLLTSDRGHCSIAENKLTVVTFNFDRSFERALFRFVLANCAENEAQAKEHCSKIPVLHLHGQLGAPSWLAQPSASPLVRPAFGEPPLPKPFAVRDYVPEDIGANALNLCVAQIRIVDEEVIHSAVQKQAVTALEDAEVICFLGFSYNPLNLQKLELPRFARKSIRGTAYRLPDGRRGSIERTFQQADSSGRSKAISLSPPDDHILTFLEKTDVIYD